MSWNFTMDTKATEEAKNATGLLEPGEYEVFITGVDPYHVAGTGTPGVQMVLTVRDDVEQRGQKKKIWETCWINPEKEVTINRLRSVFQAAVGLADGEEISPEKAKGLLGKAMRVEIEVQKYENANGEEKEKNAVTFFGFYPPTVQGEAPEEMLEKPNNNEQQDNTDPFGRSGKPIDISDDLPF